ncbi:hypothetical protein G6F43_006911 [Rhizopus delemar]|nr:hypothetical protein G6F43_006911 [Rhizopus delemar]
MATISLHKDLRRILCDHGQCLLLNCVETYARLPLFDDHFERFKISRNQLPSSFLPGANGRYENVHITVVNNDDSNKLIIGIKSFSVLATSTSRLAIDATPLVDASSINGELFKV